MQLSANSLTVLERRYLARNTEGNLIESPEDMFRRVAKFIASAEEKYTTSGEIKNIEEKFYEIMTNLEFLPNSPTLMNAGRDLGQLSACFVLPVEDSMEGIFEAVKNAALIHKSGGGTGFSFTRLRGKGSTVDSTGGVASGPISFMKVFNSATEAVKQGGRRRGANMGILRIDHPDIVDFIKCKEENDELNNFNISVGITEEFMKAVEENREYNLLEPRTKEVVGSLNATEVFNTIVSMAWTNGEPGIVFLDRINRDNIVPEVGEIESTNPCGEQPLLPYESCNLGSINLSKMIKNIDGEAKVDYERLGEVVDLSVHFLDNVIDVNKYPLKEIEDMTKSNRKIGLGVMGFADMLVMLGIPYNSPEGVKLANEVMEFIDKRSNEKSIQLASVRGTFPNYDRSIFKDKDIELRNGTTTTIAPTGSISIIAGASSGIEPLFALCYFRNVMDDDKLIEVNPLFKEYLEKEGIYSEELMEKVAEKGCIQDIKEIPDYIKRIFVTSHDISPEWHIKMQAAFQNNVDNAVSKTVNFKHDATKEEVAETYILAYKLGCKGVTIYRDGSRDGQVLNIGKVKDAKEEEVATTEVSGIVPRTRPMTTMGITDKVRIGCGNLYITANYDEKGICEVFTNLGRAGGCPSQSEATSRLISIGLRAGISAEAIIEQLKGIRCHSTLRQRGKGNNGINVLSCPDAIGKTLEKVMNMSIITDDQNIEDIAQEIEYGEESGCLDNCSLCSMSEMCNNELTIGVDEAIYEGKAMNTCPECGNKVEHEGGCVMCRSCGYSKCG
ncbi:vitamin B12-dependent ribonucleotide reductase [Wukongibacter baidiensis]|uniref:vitamin B12-dependent ribonucleotide reductase n=1 Tax=Wukongibacter baidiensis TaxID=1723361 RepID=UPI003D7F70E6